MIDPDVLETMVGQYIGTALWAGTTDDGPDTDPYPLDSRYSEDDVSDDALTLIRADVLVFAHRAWAVAETNGWDAEQFAHDYYLTRNGHGAGFRDRTWAPDHVGRFLAGMAAGMGESVLYVGDDGRLYL